MPDAAQITIAIDGYASCGKSTLARTLSKALSYTYIDTGAMYRAVALYMRRHELDAVENDQLKAALMRIELSFAYDQKDGRQRIYLNKEDVEDQIRTMDMGRAASQYGQLPLVRAFLVRRQQYLGSAGGVVMDGRDIGTVVFPHAELKIFMTARQDVRIARRWEELKPKHPVITREEVARDLELRDYEDTHREESPLRQAEDAHVLDNSDLSPDEQTAMATAWARERLEAKRQMHSQTSS